MSIDDDRAAELVTVTERFLSEADAAAVVAALPAPLWASLVQAIKAAVRAAHAGEPADDRLLHTDEVAAMLGISPKTWSSQLSVGSAPPPDDPDLSTPVNRRRPRWRESTVMLYRIQHPARRKRQRKPE